MPPLNKILLNDNSLNDFDFFFDPPSKLKVHHFYTSMTRYHLCIILWFMNLYIIKHRILPFKINLVLIFYLYFFSFLFSELFSPTLNVSTIYFYIITSFCKLLISVLFASQYIITNSQVIIIIIIMYT